MASEQISFLDIVEQDASLREEIVERIRDVAESGRFALGPYVERFEDSFASYCGSRHCVGTSSGTSALHVALRVLDVGPGDEVITVAATFVATAWAITYCGATPVFIDIDPTTRTMDPDRIEEVISPRTKVILPVHLYGQPADLRSILDVADRHGIPVVEDAAQAHGARIGDVRAGSLGTLGCFSFYPGKNLGAYGEAGAVVTNEEDLAERARSLRDHGQRRRYYHDELGFNYRMDNIQGAVLDLKLAHLDAWNRRRRTIARRYRSKLENGRGLDLPLVREGVQPSWHLFVIEHANRDHLARALATRGIQTGMHYPVPVHLQRPYQHLPVNLPHTERLSRRCLSLPIHPQVTRAQVDRVCEAVTAVT